MDLGKLRLRGIIEINLVLGNLKVISNTERAKDTNLMKLFLLSVRLNVNI